MSQSCAIRSPLGHHVRRDSERVGKQWVDLLGSLDIGKMAFAGQDVARLIAQHIHRTEPG